MFVSVSAYLCPKIQLSQVAVLQVGHVPSSINTGFVLIQEKHGCVIIISFLFGLVWQEQMLSLPDSVVNTHMSTQSKF